MTQRNILKKKEEVEEKLPQNKHCSRWAITPKKGQRDTGPDQNKGHRTSYPSPVGGRLIGTTDQWCSGNRKWVPGGGGWRQGGQSRTGLWKPNQDRNKETDLHQAEVAHHSGMAFKEWTNWTPSSVPSMLNNLDSTMAASEKNTLERHPLHQKSRSPLLFSLPRELHGNLFWTWLPRFPAH